MTLYLVADIKSNFKTDTNPLVIPQPNQDTPKSLLTGHTDKDKNFDI